MADLTTAAAAALSTPGGYAVASGRTWDGLEPLVAAAAAHVVVPGPRARIAACAGLKLGGRAGVALLDAAPVQPAPGPGAAITVSADCARDALAVGWSVAQPLYSGDVATLLAAADLLLVSPSADVGVADDVAPVHRVRLWHEGPMATLVASGASVGVMRRLVGRLAARGVEVSALELAVLDRPAHADLVGGRALGIAGAGAAAALRRGNWDDQVRFINVEGPDDAELVGAVLAHVPAPSLD